MLLEKQTLSMEELEDQAALELPNRDMMLVTVVITNVLNNLSIDVDVRNNKIAVQVCAIVALLGTILPAAGSLDCDIVQ